MDELGTPSTDIYRAVYNGQKVFLKKYRFCSGSINHEDRAEVSDKDLRRRP